MALRKVLIGDVCRIYSGGDAPKIISDKKTADCPIPVYSNGLQDEGLYGYTNEAQIEGDVVSLTARGANSGVVFYRKEPFLPIVRLISIIPDRTRINSRYLYYLLKTKVFLASKTGAAQPQITIPAVAREEISYEIDIRTQIRIADILSAYDNLIENNQKQIKLLEEAAQRLYKEWFIDLRFPGHETTKIQNDLPEGWNIKSVNSVVDFLSGYAFKSGSFVDSGKYKIVTIKNVQDGSFDGDNVSTVDEIPSKMPNHCVLEDGDILLSLTGNVGRVCLVVGDDYLLNQRVAKLESHYHAYTYCLFRSKDMFDEMNNLANGAAQQNLSPVRTGEIKITVPSESVLDGFESVGKPIIQQMIILNKQITSLKQARDRLLPKLMSGEIDLLRYIVGGNIE